MTHTCDDPLFHEALDQAEKLAAIQQLMLSRDMVCISKSDLLSLMRNVGSDSVLRRTNTWRQWWKLAHEQ